MIKLPPEQSGLNPFTELVNATPEVLEAYMKLFRAVDHKGRYLHFDSFRHRIPEELDAKLAWALVKSARSRQLTPMLAVGEPLVPCEFLLTPSTQKAISEVDRNTTWHFRVSQSMSSATRNLTGKIINDDGYRILLRRSRASPLSGNFPEPA